MQTKKLLFPTDFTNHSIDALKEAVHLNQTLDYELIIFHAYSRPYSETSSTYDQSMQLENLEKSIDRKFDQLTEKIPNLKNYSFQFKKKLGYSIDLILEQVDEEKPDLIIMSTKGAVGLGEIWGTKTAKIIKSVDIPVIVIPVDTKLTDLDRIGLACDFSENTEYDKLDFLIKLAENKNAEIDIITLNHQEKTMTKEELANRDNVLEMMDHLSTKLNFTHHTNVEVGLIDFCRANEIGLISIVPKSYNYIERLFHESLTIRMAFQSPVPLLVLK